MVKQLLVFICFITVFSVQSQEVLVFTKTAGFRHESIEVDVDAIKKLGFENNFVVQHTEDATVFSKERLENIDIVIFLNTTGNILNEEQEQQFEHFIKNGGGFVGIHSAADTEYDWEWYNKLDGAYFLSHPDQSNAELIKTNVPHISTKHLPEVWHRFDEWYNYKSMNQDVQVLILLDENTYQGGENGDYHPIAWYHEFDGGKAFYTGGGHTKESYADADFLQHLIGGILYCMKK
jgi:type 1 glutamine amidotransferase